MSKKKDKGKPVTINEMAELLSALSPIKKEFKKPGMKIHVDLMSGKPGEPLDWHISYPGAGRKKKREVPQSDVMLFVKDNVHEYLHTDNRYGKKGEPNYNQLAEAYLEEHPEIEEGETDKISKRRLVNRLIDAYKELKTKKMI